MEPSSLLSALEDPALAVVVLASYYGVILIHECGHMIAAQSKGCAVSSIELYPVWGIPCFEEPYSRFDDCVIAWGGVAAQALIGVPLVVRVEVFGYTHSQAVNAVLAILGFFSLSTAVFNLLPLRPLDGATAWGLIRQYSSVHARERPNASPVGDLDGEPASKRSRTTTLGNSKD